MLLENRGLLIVASVITTVSTAQVIQCQMLGNMNDELER
jgi:hypothetical protein